MKLYTSKIEYLPEFISAVPISKRHRAFAGRLCAYGLLRLSLLRDFGFSAMPDISTDKNGKPFLSSSPNLHFSLSHCASRVLCAVDTLPVGCDIEESSRPFPDGLWRRLMSLSELERWQAAGQPTDDILRLWTLKESYIKLFGGSVLSLTGISFNLSGVPVCESNSTIRALVCDIPGYVVSVCTHDFTAIVKAEEISMGELLKYT